VTDLPGPRADSQIRDRTQTIGGSEIAILEAGHGPSVMLLHGFPDNARTWTTQISQLASHGYHVVAPFLPGYAPSGPPPGGQVDLRSVVKTLAGLSMSVGRGPVSLVGHDWGGTLSYLMAAFHPQAVASATVISVPHPLQSAAVLTDPRLIHHTFHHWLFQLPLVSEVALAAEDLALVDYLWRLWSPRLDDSDHITQVKNETLRAPGGIGHALGYYRAIFNELVAGTLDLPPIPVPVLVVFGGDDPTRRLTDGQHAHFTGTYRRAIIPGAGHFVHREQPESLTTLVLHWLRETAP